jgi:type I restriction enzyme S subunit
VAEHWNGDVAWITPADLGRLTGHYITTSERRITTAGYESCGTDIVPPGSVILSSRAPIGHLAIAAVPLCTNQGCKSLVPGPDVDSLFLYYSLLQAVQALRELGSGATFSEVSKSQVEEFRVALPPLAEQKRIAAALAEQMAAVERARSAAEAQLKTAKALPASYLREVFCGTEAERWPRVPLGDAGEIVSGITLGRKLSEAKVRPIAYLRVANVKDAYLDLSDVYTIEATDTEIDRLRLRDGDLLLTEGGDPDKLGRGACWRGEIVECIHQNHIFRVRFDPTQVLPGFVSAQVASQYGKAYFLANAKQTTGIATINQRVLAAFSLMVPGLEEQGRVMTTLGDCTERAGRARQQTEEQMVAINSVPAALLRRAFSGDL